MNQNTFYRNNKNTGRTLIASRDIMFLILSLGTFFFAYRWVELNSINWDVQTASITFAATIGLLAAFFALVTIVRVGNVSNHIKFGVPIIFGSAIFVTLALISNPTTLASLATLFLAATVGFVASYSIDKVYQNISLSFWKTMIVEGWSNLIERSQRIFTILSGALMILFGIITYYFSQTVVPEMADTLIVAVDEERYDQAYDQATQEERDRLKLLADNLSTHQDQASAEKRRAKQVLETAITSSTHATPSRAKAWKKSKSWLIKQRDRGNRAYVQDVRAAEKEQAQILVAYQSKLEQKQRQYDDYLASITGTTALSASIQQEKIDKLEARKTSMAKWTSLGSKAILWSLILSAILTPITMIWTRASGMQTRHSAMETFSFFEIMGAWILDGFLYTMEELAEDLGVKDRMQLVGTEPTERIRPEQKQAQTGTGGLNSLFQPQHKLQIAGTNVSVSPTLYGNGEARNMVVSTTNQTAELQDASNEDATALAIKQEVQRIRKLEKNIRSREDQEAIAREHKALDIKIDEYLTLLGIQSEFGLGAVMNLVDSGKRLSRELILREIKEREQVQYTAQSTAQNPKEIVLKPVRSAASTNSSIGTKSSSANKSLPTYMEHGFEWKDGVPMLWYCISAARGNTYKKLSGAGGVLDNLSTYISRAKEAEEQYNEQKNTEDGVSMRTQNKMVRNQSWVKFLTHAKRELEEMQRIGIDYAPVQYSE
ncbi:MAG: hypothetical protein AAGI23_09540 [Bacteroidota bacterium]